MNRLITIKTSSYTLDLRVDYSNKEGKTMAESIVVNALNMVLLKYLMITVKKHMHWELQPKQWVLKDWNGLLKKLMELKLGPLIEEHSTEEEEIEWILQSLKYYSHENISFKERMV